MTRSALLQPPDVMSSPLGVRIGSQAPRLRSVPAYSLSMGREAVDLSAAAGLILDPWQADTTCDILAVDQYGLWTSFETCTICQRQTGKGGIIETIELGGLFLFGEKLILHSAHEYKTAQEAFLRIKALIDGCADLSRHVKAIREANGEQQVLLMDGARLRFVARSKGSGRGFSAPRNILDEAYALTRTQLAALLPTMSAMPNPQVNLFSTVPDPETMPEGEEAVLPGVHKRALRAVETGEPGRLCYHDWSVRRQELPDGDPAKDPAVERTYIDLAYECNPALGIRISEDYVRSELASLGTTKFAVERLGLWPAEDVAEWQIFAKRSWLDCRDVDSAPLDPVAFALVTSEDSEWSSICIAGLRADGLGHIEVAERQPGTAWVVPWVRERVARWKPSVVVINRATPAGEFGPELVGLGVEVVSISTQDAAAASNALKTAVDSNKVRHRSQPALTMAAARVPKREFSKTWEFALTAGPFDVSPIAGCAYAMWGLATRPKQGSSIPLVDWR